MLLSLDYAEARRSSKDFLHATELTEILNEEKITIFFQPIVSLIDGSILGYEALSRGPAGSFLEYPSALFEAAKKCNRLWELENLCRTKALQQSQNKIDKKMLFINVHPDLLQDETVMRAVDPTHLAQWGFTPNQIIFELTAKTTMQQFYHIHTIFEQYSHKGYQFAVDNAGIDYSGLKCLRRPLPKYVKIDMELVRNIHREYFKQVLVQALQEIAHKMNFKLIAEGIESDAELEKIIELGVAFGQGFLLKKPQAEFSPLDSNLVEKIRQHNQKKQRTAFYHTLSMPIGEIAKFVPGVSPATSGYRLADYFHEHSGWRGVPVIDQDWPVGLVMKDNFFSNLATQYGMAVYMNRPIELIMDRQPLIVDYQMSLEKVSQIAISRSNDQLYDYILVTQEQKYCGIITVKDLLAKTTQLEVNRAKHANPLTGLPGNVLIEQVLQEAITGEAFFAVLYFDLDNFKAYNDIYGFEHGDVILRKTAQLIQQHVETLGSKNFVGHVGGDDFVVVLREVSMSGIEALCKEILKSFHEATKEWYKPSDLERQYIIAKNRHGQEEKFPLITLSIAVVTNRERTYYSPQDLAAIAGIVKKQCKLSWTNCYSIDGKAIDSYSIRL